MLSRNDPAGNILKKTVQGTTTIYKYDKANQLVSSECNGKITKYEYDAAGRLVKEGKRSYSYSWLDKVSSVKENGVEVASFTYHMDGQIATAKANGRQENFLWDNLALISRNETEYVNEPYVTGGNPILADEDVLFNDLLGSTIGIRSGKEYRETGMTAFGETDEKSAMFTGKPYIGELGYAFLFRNYRPEQGKWQTADPLGYPDGWNNLAYCNNGVTMAIDWLGAATHSYAPNNIVYGTPEICNLSYNEPDKGGSTGAYVYTYGITVTVTARRSVSYVVVCPDNCEMNGTTKTTYEYTSKSATVPNTIGEIVPGIPMPMGFNPVAIPGNLSQAAYEALIDQISGTLIDAALSTNFTSGTQKKINDTINSLLHSNGGWTTQPIDFGKCKE